MTPVNENLRQFLDAAQQLAEASGFDGFRLGLVATRQPPHVVLALSVVLARVGQQTDSAPSKLEVGPVLAFRHSFPLVELEPLLAGLDAGEVTAPLSAFLSSPVRLQPADRSSAPRSWNYIRSYKGPLGQASHAESYFGWFHEVLGEASLDPVDIQIASQTNYAYASLVRLIKAYTDLEFTSRHACPIILIAPWPVGSITASTEGERLHVVVKGSDRLETSRLILNIEGWTGDRRLDSQELQWQPRVNSRGESVYKATVELKGLLPHAVNLFLARTPVLSLRAEVSEPAPREQLETDIRMAHQVSSSQEPVGELRLSALRMESFRLLRLAELRLEPALVVIVGPNQSGKSSVLDAFQIMADAARGQLADAMLLRGGVGALITKGSQDSTIRFEVELRTSSGLALRYRLRLGALGLHDFTVLQEELVEQSQGGWIRILSREGGQARVIGAVLDVPNTRESLLSQLGSMTDPLIPQVRTTLASVAIHPYFRTGAAWVEPEAVPMRRPTRIDPGARLGPTGSNLAAALYSLKEEHPESWKDFLNIVRLAFPRMKELRLPSVSRGTVHLFWDETSGASFDASELSDGTLSFLTSLCALFQTGYSLIAIDEPEAHLHPDALLRLVGAARSLSDRQPILLTTQSDVLIGLLDETPESVVVAQREDDSAKLIKPTLEDLREWLKSFSLRDMRRELEQWGAGL